MNRRSQHSLAFGRKSVLRYSCSLSWIFRSSLPRFTVHNLGTGKLPSDPFRYYVGHSSTKSAVSMVDHIESLEVGGNARLHPNKIPKARPKKQQQRMRTRPVGRLTNYQVLRNQPFATNILSTPTVEKPNVQNATVSTRPREAEAFPNC